MNDLEIAIHGAAQRMSIFGDSNAAAFPAASKGGQYFTTLKELLARLPEPSMTGASAGSLRTSGTERKAALGRELYADLRRIARTAELMEDEIEGFENKFSLPRGKMNYQQQLDKAKSVARDAAPLEEGFISYGLAADFLEDLNADIAAFEAATRDQKAAEIESVGANAEMDAIFEQILDVRKKLKVVVENLFERNPEKLAEWLTASHIERPQKKKKTNQSPTS